jgi:hypothetical protein
MNVDTYKTSTVVFKLVEHLDCAYTLWMDSLYNCPEPAQFFKYEDTDCVGSLYANRKRIKNRRREHCSQHSGDIGVHASQDKKSETMISI